MDPPFGRDGWSLKIKSRVLYCAQLLAAAKTVVKAKAASPAEQKGVAAASAKQADYGAAVLDALRNMNSKSPTQALTNVKAPGTINPVRFPCFLKLVYYY